jgi:hypothetical protein
MGEREIVKDLPVKKTDNVLVQTMIPYYYRAKDKVSNVLSLVPFVVL